MAEDLNISTLPQDIFDQISEHLSDYDVVSFLQSSPSIVISQYILKARRERQQEKWKDAGICTLAYMGNLPGVKFLHRTDLLDKANHINEYDQIALLPYTITLNKAMSCAVEKGHIDVAEFLADSGANIHMQHFIEPVKRGDLEIIKFLHSRGVNISLSDMTCAAAEGNIAILDYFFQSTNDHNAGNCIIHAVIGGKYAAVKWLYKQMPKDVKEPKESNAILTLCMNQAAYHRKLKIVKFLNRKGVPITDDTMKHAYSNYVYTDKSEFIEILKSLKADS